MDGKRARVVDPTLDHPEIPPARQAAPPRTAVLSEGWAAVLGLGWPIVFMLMLLLQPAADNPQAVAPVLDVVVQAGLLLGLLATSVLAGNRDRAAAPVAVVTGLVTLAFVVACPVSGHHSLAPWWFAELAVVLAMLAVSVAGVRQGSPR